MATATSTAAKYDKMLDAFAAYARENGPRSANDYLDDGTALAESAFRSGVPEGVADWIDGEVEAFPESARYLIACAADFRLAELAAAPVKMGRAA